MKKYWKKSLLYRIKNNESGDVDEIWFILAALSGETAYQKMNDEEETLSKKGELVR